MEIDTSGTDWFFKISYFRIRPPEQRSPCHEGSRHKGFESGIKFSYVYSEKSIKSNLTCPYRKRKIRKAEEGGGGNIEKKWLAPLRWVNDLHSKISFRLLSWRIKPFSLSLFTITKHWGKSIGCLELTEALLSKFYVHLFWLK